MSNGDKTTSFSEEQSATPTARENAISPFHDPARWVAENDHAFAIPDGFPLAEGHTLVVPKRAMSRTSQLTEAELLGCFKLIEEIKLRLAQQRGAEGFNVGVNENEAGGQTVKQLHFHVIPRVIGDIDDPVGGIRNIFPGRGNYLKSRGED